VGPVVPLGIPKDRATVVELYATVGVEPAGNEEAATVKSLVKSIVL
jgi:hypothetical protein